MQHDFDDHNRRQNKSSWFVLYKCSFTHSHTCRISSNYKSVAKTKAWIICDTVRFVLVRWKCIGQHMIRSVKFQWLKIRNHKTFFGRCISRFNEQAIFYTHPYVCLHVRACVFAIACALIISYSYVYYDFMFSLHLFIATYAESPKASHKFLCCIIYLFVITFSCFIVCIRLENSSSQRKCGYRWNFTFSTDTRRAFPCI